MAGGGSFISDQKFTNRTSDGAFKTITGGGTDLGPCRVTYICLLYTSPSPRD